MCVCACLFLQEIAEPMFDLKVGIEELRRSRTLKYILATMLSVGNFLNGSEVSCRSVNIDAGMLVKPVQVFGHG